MFYVLNFQTHNFSSCNTAADVYTVVAMALNDGVMPDELEIINGSDSDVRMTPFAFEEMCKSLGIECYRINMTCWPYHQGEEKHIATNRFFLTKEQADECIRELIQQKLDLFNEQHQKEDVLDSDGNVVGQEYPFRCDPDGEHPNAILFWDGDDYRFVVEYDVVMV